MLKELPCWASPALGPAPQPALGRKTAMLWGVGGGERWGGGLYYTLLIAGQLTLLQHQELRTSNITGPPATAQALSARRVRSASLGNCV